MLFLKAHPATHTALLPTKANNKGKGFAHGSYGPSVFITCVFRKPDVGGERRRRRGGRETYRGLGSGKARG